MAGVNLNAIHRALADQLRTNIARDTATNPFPIGTTTYPCITVYPAAGTYIDYWKTFGPNGNADLMVRLKLEVDSDNESMFIKIADYLSVGTGFTSSIIDAIHADRTLGGTVEDALVLTAEWDAENDPSVAWLPVSIILKKQNAEVA